MWMRAPSCQDLLEVCTGMRDADAREVFALRAREDRAGLAYELYAMLPRARLAFVAGLDTSQLCAAFLALWPMDETGGVLAANLIGTPRVSRISRALIAHVKGRVIPDLLAQGVRRVECRALGSHTAARSFVRRCGAIEEAMLPDLGRDGESYTLCAWRRSDYEGMGHVHRTERG